MLDDDLLAETIQHELELLSSPSMAEGIKTFATALALKMFLLPELYWLPKGLPFLRLGETRFDPDFKMLKMSGFQAGLTHRWQQQLKALQNARRSNVVYWDALLAEQNLQRRGVLSGSADLIRYPFECASTQDREKILEASERYGLGIAPAYPQSVAGIPGLPGGFDPEQYPVAQRLSRRLVTLPVHPGVSSRDRKKIARLLGRTSDGFAQQIPSCERRAPWA